MNIDSSVTVDGLGKGFVRFVGHVHFRPGEWVGIELSKPRGKNNGTVLGKSYFTCAPNHGIFVLANSPTLHTASSSATFERSSSNMPSVQSYSKISSFSSSGRSVKSAPARYSTTSTSTTTSAGLSRRSTATSISMPTSTSLGSSSQRKQSAILPSAASPRARSLSASTSSMYAAKRTSLMPFPQKPPTQQPWQTTTNKRLTLSSLPSPPPESPLTHALRRSPMSSGQSQHSEHSYQLIRDSTHHLFESSSVLPFNENMMRVMQELKTRTESLEAENKFLQLEVEHSKATMEISRLINSNKSSSDDIAVLVSQQVEEGIKKKEQQYLTKVKRLEKELHSVEDEKQRMIDDIQQKVEEVDRLELQRVHVPDTQVVELKRILEEKTTLIAVQKEQLGKLQLEVNARDLMVQELDDITKSIELLEEETTNKAQQVKKLELSLQQTTAQLEERASTVNKLEQAKDRLTLERKADMTRIQELNNEMNEYKTRIDLLVQDTATNRSMDMIQEQISTAQANVICLEQELVEKNAALRRVEHLLQNKTTSFEKLEQELSDVWSTKTQLEMELGDKTRLAISLTKQLEVYQTNSVSVKEELTQVRVEHAQSLQQIIMLEKQLAMVQTTMNEQVQSRQVLLEQELDIVKRNADDDTVVLRNKVNQLSSQLNERDDRIARLETNADDQMNQISTLERKVREMKKARRETMSSYMESVDLLMTDMTKLQFKYDDVSKRASFQSALTDERVESYHSQSSVFSPRVLSPDGDTKFHEDVHSRLTDYAEYNPERTASVKSGQEGNISPSEE